MLAYGEDTAGRRQFTIRIKDLATGKTLPDEIRNTPASIAWADDNKTLFYVENDPITLLTVRVRKHVLGTDAASDPVVYEERDHSYYMGVGRSGDDKYIVIDEHSTLSSEIRFIPASQPKAKFRVLGAARARLRVPRRSHRPALGRSARTGMRRISASCRSTTRASATRRAGANSCRRATTC